MKTFPKNVYVWLNGNGNPMATLCLEQVAPGSPIGVYELRAIKAVKRETVLIDVPPDPPHAEIGIFEPMEPTPPPRSRPRVFEDIKGGQS